ncbi:TerB family tellurite resistance protein [Malonomonas rubra]|uniref:tellurite resistance TerB family protein n=1 Tax=Malonomonas rubra TaxID=57040 RepID=UPI0026F11324|nr:TerB family tellurite resistance protein [Malonomonas rubra]
MLKRLLQVFAPAEAHHSENFDRIPLAAAVLLLEVAHADGDYHVEEEKMIETVMKNHFSVADELLEELLALAEKTRQDSSDLHQFTRKINKAFNQTEKEQIIEAIWKLVYADGRLDHFEEALMRQLGTLIGLSHRQLIEAKLRVAKK